MRHSAKIHSTTWKILRKLRCCPWKAGRLAKAIHVLQIRQTSSTASIAEGRRMAVQGQPGYAFRASCSGEVPVMAGPGGEIVAGAGGRGHLRASHADREQVIGTLKAAFVQGMLAKDEFDLRVGQALASRTYADLTALTADLPAGLTAAKPPQPVPSQ